jgi:hypothetical protein
VKEKGKEKTFHLSIHMGWKTNAGHEGRRLVPYLSSMFRSSFHPSHKVMVDDVRSPFMGAFEFIIRNLVLVCLVSCFVQSPTNCSILLVNNEEAEETECKMVWNVLRLDQSSARWHSFILLSECWLCGSFCVLL